MTGPAASAGIGTRRHRWIAAALLWMPVALGLAVLAATGEAGAVVKALSGTQPAWLAGLLLIGLLLPVVHARRWRALLRAVRADVPLLEAIDMTVSASLMNYALPGYVGSPTKGILTRQLHGVGLGRSAPTLAVEQVLDALSLTIGAAIGLLLVGPAGLGWVRHALDRSTMVALIGAVLMLGAVGVAAFLVGRRHGRRFITALAESSRMLASDRSQRGRILLLTFTYWLLGLSSVWIAAAAVGLRLGPPSLLLVGNLPMLLGLLSPVPGGVGLREAAMAATAGAIGVPVAGIVAAAVLQRAILVAALPLTLALVRLRRRSVAWR